jgi:peptidyl-prolyl cis-trans isomerase SurA
LGLNIASNSHSGTILSNAIKYARIGGMTNNLQLSIFVALLFLGTVVQASPRKPSAASADQVVDAVLASIDGEPVTLADLQKIPHSDLRKSPVSLTDEKLKTELDRYIFEQLIIAESKKRRISITDQEVDLYVSEVESKNGLTSAEFERALAKEGLTLAKYRAQIKIDILRSRLASAIASETTAIPELDVDQYIDLHPEYKPEGEKVKIRQIFLSNQWRSAEQLDAVVENITDTTKSVADFSQLANQFSDSPDRERGGLVGLVIVKNLDDDTRLAIAGLDAGEISKPLITSNGVRLLMVERRFAEGDEQALRDEVRELLRQSRMAQHVDEFLKSTLFKLHSVEKNI